MIKKIGELQKEFDKENLITYLKEKNNLLPSIPYVVGLFNDKLRLMFKRFFFKFEDTYEISIEHSTDNEIVITLKGDASTIKLLYKIYTNKILLFADYTGPRKRIVWPKLRNLAYSILEHAVNHSVNARNLKQTTARDFSRKLADISWISKLLMKSMLVKTMDVSIIKGEFNKFIEDLHSQGIFNKYKVVYVSGSGNGSFRLLFINGQLAGTYAIISGDELLEDPTALNKIEGLYRVKIYGSFLHSPEAIE
ncbi:MAG: hypothetical protein GSR72_03730 [Desulfurococcales archaeon]|nr:hypothetical protein [Desulfurococcales archaeon]MEB3788985.1 hypothetical protein [Desulfurococcales archaeon]